MEKEYGINTMRGILYALWFSFWIWLFLFGSIYLATKVF